MSINRRKKLLFAGSCKKYRKVLEDCFFIYNKERIQLQLETEDLTSEIREVLENQWQVCDKENVKEFEVKLNYVELRHLMKIIKTTILHKFREGQLEEFDGQGSEEKKLYDVILKLKESLEKK